MKWPWRAQAYLAAVVATGLCVLGVSLWLGNGAGISSGDVLPVALLTALALVANHFPLQTAPARKTNAVPAVYLVAVLLFSPVVTLALVAATQVIGGLWLRSRRNAAGKRLRSLRDVSFNVGQYLLAVGLSAFVYRAFLSQASARSIDDVKNVWAIPAAWMVLFLINTVAVALMVAVLRGENPVRVWLKGRRESTLHALSLFPVSVATALLTAHYPWAPLVMVLPAAMLHLSLQNMLRLVKQAEELAKREAEAAALRELDRMKNELLSTVSHELRTPLTVIHGYASRLQRSAGVLDPAAVEETAGRILMGSTQLSRLVSDLGDFGRASRGDLDLQIEVFDLAELLRDMAPDFCDRLGDRLTIEVPHRVEVVGDEIRIAQILSNLVDNAAKYAPQGAVTLRIVKSGESIRTELEDRGPGIPTGEQPLIWSKFFRGGDQPHRRQPGSGIGLAVVKALVEAQHGEVGLVSQPGRGSCFWFELPAPTVVEADLLAASAPVSPDQPTAVPAALAESPTEPRPVPAPQRPSLAPIPLSLRPAGTRAAS